jgi:alkanesulfonate monooxygenase SsuD/methylene tetrahydromethanopterin reductase-like flavin-dependent oxidoreductase (luciferase family)
VTGLPDAADGHGSVRLGALAWAQHVEWGALMRAGARIDELGYDHLWAWDHLVPILGRHSGPIHEAFMTLAGWASVTRHVTLGPMVAANTFRNPALLAKMITALDHMSGGRAILGLGAAWFEPEHRAFGFDFGSGVGERLDRLDEAAALIHDMLRGRTTTARGVHYTAAGVANDPPPVHGGLRLLIGGGGERRTLATVARYADAWNVGGDVAEVRHKDEVLREWCERVGRDQSEIERTLSGESLVIRDTVAEARRVAADLGACNGGWEGPTLLGPPNAIVDHFAPFVEIGFRTIHIDCPAPFDDETMERFVGDVKPALQALVPAERLHATGNGTS